MRDLRFRSFVVNGGRGRNAQQTDFESNNSFLIDLQFESSKISRMPIVKCKVNHRDYHYFEESFPVYVVIY